MYKVIDTDLLDMGWFQLSRSSTGGTYLTVIDSGDPTFTNCGKVWDGENMTDIPCPDLEVTEDSYVVYFPYTTRIALHPMTDNYINGILLGRVYVNTVEGSIVDFDIIQEHHGLISLDADYPFRIQDRTSGATVQARISHGYFVLNNTSKHLLQTDLAITTSCNIYVKVSDTISPEVLAGDFPDFDTDIAYILIGYVHVQDGAITRVEQYIRGFFEYNQTTGTITNVSIMGAVNNGYFTIVGTASNEVTVIDSHDPNGANCGYVFDGEYLLPIAKTALSITGSTDYFILLNKDLQTVRTQLVTDENIDGIVIGRAYTSSSSSGSSFFSSVGYTQEHKGLIDIPATSGFMILQTNYITVQVQIGRFLFRDVQLTNSLTDLTITETVFIYVEVVISTLAVTVKQGTSVPADTTSVVNILIGKVYFNTRVTRVEQYIRGWFSVSGPDTNISSSSCSSSLELSDIDGYFTLAAIGTTLSVVDGNNPTASTCGYISLGTELQAVTKISETISADSFIILDIDLATISVQPMTDTAIFGVLLGRVYLSGGILTLVQEHKGLVYDSPLQDFDIVAASTTTVAIGSGDFAVNNEQQSLTGDTLTVTETGTVYITAVEGISPEVHIGTLPTYSETTAYVPIGYVYFDGTKITKIEQYIRSWFHCHTWGDCDE